MMPSDLDYRVRANFWNSYNLGVRHAAEIVQVLLDHTTPTVGEFTLLNRAKTEILKLCKEVSSNAPPLEVPKPKMEDPRQ